MTNPEEALKVTDLLPCPFCGGDAEYVIGFRDDHGFGARCTRNYCAVSTRGHPTKERATYQWNQRSTPTPEPTNPAGVSELPTIVGEIADDLERQGHFWRANRLREAAALTRTPAPDAGLREALEFYANAWEQDVDAERTHDGWVGSVGPVEPSAELLNDMGDKARAALSQSPRPDDGMLEEVVGALEDALSGWRYIRHTHGDLWGVGWDRVEAKLTATLARVRQGKGGNDATG